MRAWRDKRSRVARTVANQIRLIIATEAATETPAAAETTTEAAKEETAKEVVPVEAGQLEHKGSNFPKYAHIY